MQHSGSMRWTRIFQTLMLLEKGELLPIREWLTDKVHQYGALKKPCELLQEATGEGLNAKYLADYLQEKYTKPYQS